MDKFRITRLNGNCDVMRLPQCLYCSIGKVHFWVILFIVSSFLGTSLCIASPKVEFIVSPTGNDHNPGTIDKPFASLERARNAIRELKQKSGLPSGGVTISIRGGTYSLSKTFELTEKDAGTISRAAI